MTRGRIALRSLKNLCAFVGAVGMFSFFYNWSIDIRHWSITLASAIACSILWFCFYLVEAHKEAVNSLGRAALGWLSRLRTKQSKLPFTVATEPEEHLPELLWSKRFLEVY